MIKALDEEEFRVFFTELREEAKANNDHVTEEEARELFELIKGEYNEMMKANPSDLDDGDTAEDDDDGGILIQCDVHVANNNSSSNRNRK